MLVVSGVVVSGVVEWCGDSERAVDPLVGNGLLIIDEGFGGLTVCAGFAEREISVINVSREDVPARI